MGSGVSKSDTNGVTLPARFRLVFLQRLEELTARRHNRPLKDSTPSKKELLLHDNDSQHTHNDSVNHSKKPEEPKPKENSSDKEKGVATRIETKHDVVKEESLKTKGKDETKENVVRDEKAKEDVFKDFDHEDEDNDDDDNDDGRMIGHEDDEAFPGSPSFRIYFNDNREDDHNDVGKADGLKSKAPSSDEVSTKDPSMRKQVKSGKKRRSFKHVFPKGGQAAVKNLLNVKACYTPSHSSHERNRLLADKPNT